MGRARYFSSVTRAHPVMPRQSSILAVPVQMFVQTSMHSVAPSSTRLQGMSRQASRRAISHFNRASLIYRR